MMFARETFQLFETCAPWLTAWIALFVVWTAWRVGKTLLGLPVPASSHFLIDEAPGLPLALLHTVAFVMSILRLDLPSTLLFAWWGPGFLIVAAIYVRSKQSGVEVNWQPIARVTSIGCKLCYAILMAIYFAYGMYGVMFTFSLWIMHDQVRLAWFRGSGDRTRRTFEDFWIVRILYPGLLLVPFLTDGIANRRFAMLFGALTLLLWFAGLARLRASGRFFETPGPDSDNLRDIVYLPSSSSPGSREPVTDVIGRS